VIAVVVYPSGWPERVTLPPDGNEQLEAMQQIVGGDLELIQGPFGSCLWVNEDGRRLELPVNAAASWVAQQQLLGPMIVTGGADSEGRTTSIDPKFARVLHTIAT
jgi:hypothetical protein